MASERLKKVAATRAIAKTHKSQKLCAIALRSLGGSFVVKNQKGGRRRAKITGLLRMGGVAENSGNYRKTHLLCYRQVRQNQRGRSVENRAGAGRGNGSVLKKARFELSNLFKSRLLGVSSSATVSSCASSTPKLGSISARVSEYRNRTDHYCTSKPLRCMGIKLCCALNC